MHQYHRGLPKTCSGVVDVYNLGKMTVASYSKVKGQKDSKGMANYA